MALVSVAACFSHRFRATEYHLRLLGDRHFHDGSRPETFSEIRDVMLETLADFLGEDCNEALQDEWCAALNLAIDGTLGGYEGTQTSWPG